MKENINKDIIDYRINQIKTSLDIAFDTNVYYIENNTIEIKKVNTVKLANLFDFEVEESDILPVFNDGILYVDNVYKKIIVNKNRSLSNKRCIIMYLLSYYLLHANENEKHIFLQTFDTEEDIKYRDKDAEYMARNILIPKEELNKVKNYYWHPTLCTKIFSVNLKIMFEQLNYLKNNCLVKKLINNRKENKDVRRNTKM